MSKHEKIISLHKICKYYKFLVISISFAYRSQPIELCSAQPSRIRHEANIFFGCSYSSSILRHNAKQYFLAYLENQLSVLKFQLFNLFFLQYHYIRSFQFTMQQTIENSEIMKRFYLLWQYPKKLSLSILTICFFVDSSFDCICR